MGRIARLLNNDQPTIYHVLSRTALDGYPIGDIEKEYFLGLIKKYSKLYLVDILGFSLMDNHVHILLKMYPGHMFSDEQLRQRFIDFYGDDNRFDEKLAHHYRDKWSNLSEFMRELKLRFTLYYNKRHNRSGYFWGSRFKSMILEEGDALLHCLAYIDLNPVRAGIVDLPEKYRWNSLGYLIQTGNRDGLLSLEFGLFGQERLSLKEKIANYRKFVYETGAVSEKGRTISQKDLKRERGRGFQISRSDCFKYRTRYFTDSGVIGSKRFVEDNYRRFKSHFLTKREKIPKSVAGLEGIFSLKGLS